MHAILRNLHFKLQKTWCTPKWMLWLTKSRKLVYISCNLQSEFSLGDKLQRWSVTCISVITIPPHHFWVTNIRFLSCKRYVKIFKDIFARHLKISKDFQRCWPWMLPFLVQFKLPSHTAYRMLIFTQITPHIALLSLCLENRGNERSLSYYIHTSDRYTFPWGW